jgi:hypothetical protein
MPLEPFLIVLAVVFMLWTAWSFVHKRRQRRYRRGIYHRESAVSQWRAEFPGSMPTVERVLELFCDAFLFHRRYRFHFRPDDMIREVYAQTTGPVADEMQMETLLVDLDKEFGVDLDPAEILGENGTLADLVAAVIAAAGREG